MSLYSDPRGVRPGPVRGNAADGLDHRVAVSVRRVLDCCIKKLSETVFLPIGKPKKLSSEVIVVDKRLVKPPLRFISAASSNSAAVVDDLVITRLEERPVFARIRCNIAVPMRVNFEDIGGKRISAISSFSVPQDVIMYVPDASIFPFEVTASASCTCTSGRFVEPNVFQVNASLTLIIKVATETDLLVPAYGICPTPKAVDFETEVSQGFFDLPLYPRGREHGRQESRNEGGINNA